MDTTADLQTAIRKAEREVRRLERLPDPGKGRPPAEAQALRQRHLRQLDSATSELEGLRAEWQAGEPAEIEKRSFADRILRSARRQTIEKMQTEEDKTFLRQLHENMHEREQERKAAQERRDAEERAAHPPDPRAESIAAAVLSDPVIVDMLSVQLRPIERSEGEYTQTHLLDAHDVGVLASCLHLLTERNPLVIEGWAQYARWPRREPPIAFVEKLRESLIELKRTGFLDLRVQGGTAQVSYGPRTRKIAKRWGIELPEGA